MTTKRVKRFPLALLLDPPLRVGSERENGKNNYRRFIGSSKKRGSDVKLFSKAKQNISLHIRNIFKEGELIENEVVKDSLTTATDGKKYKVTHIILM